MPTISRDSSPFLYHLFQLLADRKQLKVLATKYRSQYLVNGRSTQTADVQTEITDLVLPGVHDPRDQFRKLTPDLFEKLLFNLLGSSCGWEWVDDLEAFWRNPIPGLSFHLDAAVQLRLTELCGPLDEVIAALQDSFA